MRSILQILRTRWDLILAIGWPFFLCFPVLICRRDDDPTAVGAIKLCLAICYGLLLFCGLVGFLFSWKSDTDVSWVKKLLAWVMTFCAALAVLAVCTLRFGLIMATFTTLAVPLVVMSSVFQGMLWGIIATEEEKARGVR